MIRRSTVLRITLAGLTVAGLTMGGLAAAQTTFIPAPGRALPQAVQGPRSAEDARMTGDPTADVNRRVDLAFSRERTLQSRVISLESRIGALEATLRKTQPALTFTCSADGHSSQNSLGVVEQCGAYLCAPIDGRCRRDATNTGECAGGYYWDNAKSCVPPKPKSDSCDGFFC